MALNNYADDLQEPLDFWAPATRQAEEDVNIQEARRLDTSARELNTRLFAELLFEVESRTTDMDNYLQKTQRESQNELALFDRQYTAHHSQLINPSLEYLAAFASEQRLSRVLVIMRHHARALGGRLREIADFSRRLDHLSTRVTHLFPISATYAERLGRFRRGQMSESGASEASPFHSDSDSDAGSSDHPPLPPSDGTEATPIVINGSSPEAPDKSAKRKKRAKRQGKSGKPKKRRRTDSFDEFTLTPPTPRPKSGKGKGKRKTASSAPSSPSSRSESAAIPDVASDEEPYDSEPGLDHLPLVYEPVHVLEQSHIESTLNNFVGFVEVSRQIHSPLPADLDRLADALIDMVHVIVERGRRVANAAARLEAQQFNQEVPRIRQALERLINNSAAEPTPAPTPQGNLCGGRMSDGSSCEIPRDNCFLRHEGVHVDDASHALCYGPSIKAGKHSRCRNYWRRCKVHNPNYHRSYYKTVNKVPDESSARGLVHNRSTLLREIERTFGNRSHTVRSKSGGGRSKSRSRADDEKEEELYLRGPQYPTHLTYDRRRDRWANITRFLVAVDQGPDADDQGPDGPPDNHPNDDAQPPDSPPAGGAANLINV
ncbi:hypothetical protein Ae201684P_000074 [Aphanomyces euteiches]|nr:hypothetical protein Ae201684P_000074 [Aphanomyces euteiches]